MDENECAVLRAVKNAGGDTRWVLVESLIDELADGGDRDGLWAVFERLNEANLLELSPGQGLWLDKSNQQSGHTDVSKCRLTQDGDKQAADC